MCDEDFANDLEDFYNASRDNIHNAIIDRRMHEDGFDKELDQIRKDFNTTQSYIKKLKQGKDTVAKQVVAYLNRIA